MSQYPTKDEFIPLKILAKIPGWFIQISENVCPLVIVHKHDYIKKIDKYLINQSKFIKVKLKQGYIQRFWKEKVLYVDHHG